MDFFVLILFVLAMVARAFSETKRKQEQHKNEDRSRQETRRARPMDMERPEESPGPFGGPWEIPFPGLPGQEPPAQTAEVEQQMPQEHAEEDTHQPAPNKYQKYMKGMGPEGSRSTEGARKETKQEETKAKKRKTAVQRIPRVAASRAFDLDDMAKGVVMAEILGPPRSKRPFGK